MQTFAATYPDYEFTQAGPAQITWYHNQTILDKVSDPTQRAWYIKKTIENGWSRNVLALQIDSHLYDREGKAITNFQVRSLQTRQIYPKASLRVNIILSF